MQFYLKYLHDRSPSQLASGHNIQGNVLIDQTAMINSGCVIGTRAFSFYLFVLPIFAFKKKILILIFFYSFKFHGINIYRT